ncbi:MAG: hypothetical protein EP330_30095 [Deltaproteobacteria bacterium]|nr:MAG: hypothetical protein EP330_30095 [Deltaproteobacteria bacterium]
MDPRLYQIATLGGLLAWGVIALDHDIRWELALAMALAAQGTQLLACRWLGLRYDPKSPLISTLSLILLLRTHSLAIAVLAGVLTIGSKFVLRVRGKHVFNPTNFGIAVCLLAFDGAWVSPGRWGTAATWAFGLACIGGLVVNRARRADVTWAFLGFWLALVFGRALVLGDPLRIALHQVQNGAFLIFAFFMISDPKTTPDSRLGRVLFALLVALFGYYGTFFRFEPNALLYSLVGCAVLTPLLDHWLPGETYSWAGSAGAASPAGAASSAGASPEAGSAASPVM